MNYQQTLDYLYSQLPMFTRDGASAYKEDLHNTIELCKRLGDPQRKFKSIHIAGTNGKGSTSHMLAAILQVAGYKTGLYTSPHLRDFRERVRINGEMTSEQHVVDFVEQQRSNFEDIQPSFFEMTVGLAFDAFAQAEVDIAVIEVGLGGRLDSTNIITPLVSVITNIGWDHMNILGNTLQLIAGEKAGIIKPNIPVVVGEYQAEVAKVFLKKAEEQDASILFASEEWKIWEPEMEDSRTSAGGQVENLADYLNISIRRTRGAIGHYLPSITDLKLDLTGTYQLKNIKTVLSAVDELVKLGFIITDEHIKKALSEVKKLTGLHGRWEAINRHPLTICDTGHNPEGIAEVLTNIRKVLYHHLHFVIGVVNDKDISKMLAVLPSERVTYYFCKPNIPRGLNAERLKQKAADYDLLGDTYSSVKDALAAAQKNADEHDLVFVGGSTFVVAEVV